MAAIATTSDLNPINRNLFLFRKTYIEQADIAMSMSLSVVSRDVFGRWHRCRSPAQPQTNRQPEAGKLAVLTPQARALPNNLSQSLVRLRSPALFNLSRHLSLALFCVFLSSRSPSQRSTLALAKNEGPLIQYVPNVDSAQSIPNRYYYWPTILLYEYNTITAVLLVLPGCRLLSGGAMAAAAAAVSKKYESSNAGRRVAR